MMFITMKDKENVKYFRSIYNLVKKKKKLNNENI